MDNVLTQYVEESRDALKWFKNKGIKAYIDSDKTSIYVEVNGVDVLLSGSEVSYRADLYRSETEVDHG